MLSLIEKKRKSNRLNNERNEVEVDRFFELPTTSKKCVTGLNLHEIKN